jgi:hypothetical protein
MHLGFHIYDLGFQSQNSEAAKPMVFTTTLLLIAMIAAAEPDRDRLRTRLRRASYSPVLAPFDEPRETGADALTGVFSNPNP